MRSSPDGAGAAGCVATLGPLPGPELSALPWLAVAAKSASEVARSTRAPSLRVFHAVIIRSFLLGHPIVR